jgi:Flp pilus assembly protein TadG
VCGRRNHARPAVALRRTVAGLRGERQGQATLEAAIVLPLLLVMIIGMVGVAQVLHASTMTVLAANRGARLGAVLYGDSALTPADRERQLTDAVQASLGAGLKGTDYTIEITTDETDIHVMVTYNQKLTLPWVKWLLGGDTWKVQHESIYRLERR